MVAVQAQIVWLRAQKVMAGEQLQQPDVKKA